MKRFKMNMGQNMAMKRGMIGLGLAIVGLLLSVGRVQGQPSARPELLGQIVYTQTDAAGIFQLHVLDLATDRSTILTAGTGDSYLPQWSPDGQSIAYMQMPSSDFGAVPGVASPLDQLMVIGPDGSNPVAITDGSYQVASVPLGWSPDSQFLLYGSFFDDPAQTIAEADFYTVRRDGSGLTPLNIDFSGGQNVAGGWSANNQVVLLENGIFQLIGVDGTRAFNFPAGAGYYALQPDHTGTALTIVDNEAGLNNNERWIGTLPLTGGEPNLIAPLLDPLGVVYGAAWSPTGAHVAVSMELVSPDTSESLGYVVAVLEVATGNWVTLDGAETNIFDWSPDGRILAYTYLNAGPLIIYGYDTVTGGNFPIVLGTQPDWR